MRCDLHVHTRHSGMCDIPLLNRLCRESYSEPEAVYQTLKRRGMDLVTVTDHDSMEAADSLRRHPDFFASEEVTCLTPSGTEIHVGVFGIEERDHVQLQRRRTDVPALAAYLVERRIFFCINHVFSSLTGRRAEQDYELFAELFPAVEILNGQIPAGNNAAATRLGREWKKTGIAGSDSHTLSSLGLTYTQVPAATSAESFLEGLKHGHALAAGAAGSYWKLTRTVTEIGLELLAEKPWLAAFTPALLLAPVVTFANRVLEFLFEYKWSRRIWSGAAGQPAEQLFRL